MRWWCLLALLVAAGCGDDPGLEDLRLVPMDDPDYGALEPPEEVGECGVDAGCVATCVHACAPDVPGPITCPKDPPPLPERLVDAHCACEQAVCAWMPSAGDRD